MFIGHYSAAFAAKGIERQVPLWIFVLAVQLVDVGWSILVLLGIEKVRIVPGFMAGSPLDLYYMPYTHSLLATFIWGAVVFALARFLPGAGRARAAAIVALAVMSHWLLDLLVHAQDLALYDDTMKMGFGLWNYPLFENTLELLLLYAAYVFFCRGATSRQARATLNLVVVMTILQVVNIFMPPPPSAQVMAVMALLSYGVLTVMAWRAERAPATADSR
jgi:membrane-bound metal-dependent hydrolase YbcI (DUF457 family)